MSHGILGFLMVSPFLNSKNCSRSVLAKNWRLYTVVAASACKKSMRLAASRIQFVQGWPPVACNTSKNGGHLPATGGHPGTIWMRLAASRPRNSGRLAASRMHAGEGVVVASRRRILHALAASTGKVASFLQARCDNNYFNLKMKKL